MLGAAEPLGKRREACEPLCAATASNMKHMRALPLLAAVAALTACGSPNIEVRLTIKQYEQGNYNAASQACSDASEDLELLGEKGRVRYLTYCGYQVTWVVNITDVDDKLIKESNERRMSMADLAVEMTEDYMANLRALDIDTIDQFPRATAHMADIMATKPGNEPVAVPLVTVFHME